MAQACFSGILVEIVQHERHQTEARHDDVQAQNGELRNSTSCLHLLRLYDSDDRFSSAGRRIEHGQIGRG